MIVNRRQFLGSTTVAASTLAAAPPNLSVFESVRKEFPRATQQTYLDAAANMPLPTYTAEGMRRYIDFQVNGSGEGRGQYANEATRQVKPLFAKLINASHRRLVSSSAPKPARPPLSMA